MQLTRVIWSTTPHGIYIAFVDHQSIILKHNFFKKIALTEVDFFPSSITDKTFIDFDFIFMNNCLPLRVPTGGPCCSSF
jgi:hypothetical protein